MTVTVTKKNPSGIIFVALSFSRVVSLRGLAQNEQVRLTRSTCPGDNWSKLELKLS
jgi:hypothetical protein